MKEHPKGSNLDAEAFSSYVLAQDDATVDAASDPFVITLFRPGRAPERWELKKQGRKGTVSWLRR